MRVALRDDRVPAGPRAAADYCVGAAPLNLTGVKAVTDAFLHPLPKPPEGFSPSLLRAANYDFIQSHCL